MKKHFLLLATVLAAACGSSTPESTTPESTASASAAATSTPAPTETAAATAAPTSTPVATATATAAPTGGPPDAKNGEKLFADNHCDGCHGTKAAPGKKAPNIFKFATSPKFDDKAKAKAIDIIKKGKSPMPGFGDKLNDSQIADVLAFVAAK